VRRGIYPGSFDPLTVAHLAIADAAHDQCGLDTLDMCLSRVALAKDGHHHALDDRVGAIVAAGRARPWLGAIVTDVQLVADIAQGYDVVVMGADKWAQLHDVAFYEGSEAQRDAALARLPEVAIAPRPPAAVAAGAGVVVLDVPADLAQISSTGVRAGRSEWDGRAAD
jgi:hypothetical protein